MNTCATHDPEALTREWPTAPARNFCTECRGRVCLRCHQVDAISWQSGYCDGCYRVRRLAQQQFQHDYDRQRKRVQLAEAWEEGRKVGSEAISAENPYLSDSDT